MPLLQDVCSLPTAPMAEDAVVRFVERFVSARPALALSRDRFGNLLLELQGRPPRRTTPRWVFAAHIDHPGLIARRMTGPRTLDAHFRGGVLTPFVRRAPVRFTDPKGQEIPGTITAVLQPDPERPTMPGLVRVHVDAPVPPGAPGMFDLGLAKIRAGKLHSRAIDDLGGVASALAMLDKLCRRPPKADVAVLLTRAEESGFVGAIAAVKHPTLLRKSDRIISIECSSQQPYAPMGAGVVIRVGDRTSVFNAALTYFLTEQAISLAKKDKAFAFQRALMPGGTCEATVYDCYGYTSAAVCIPLGNYHNMDKAKNRLAPEYIALSDWNNMVKLFVHLAKTAHTFTPDNAPLKARLEKRFNRLKKWL